MKKFTLWDTNGEPHGNTVNVSDEWYADVVAAHPGIENLSLSQLQAMIVNTQALAQTRDIKIGNMVVHQGELTDEEHKRIWACDHVRNLNARVAFTQGRDVDTLYGEVVPRDKVQFARWSPDTCGCVVTRLWREDHGGEGQPARVHHPHMTHKKCDKHAHLDGAEHDKEVQTRNDHKNAVVNTVAEHIGVHPDTVGWNYDEADTLVASHEKIVDDHMLLKKLAAHPVAGLRSFAVKRA